MESRVDKYKDKEYKPSRVEKNKDLYHMIYTAYDEFENYKVPLEEKEIDLSNVRKSVTNRVEYMKAKKYSEFTNTRISRLDNEDNNTYTEDEEVYDIKELLDKVKDNNVEERKTEIQEEKYIDKLHLDSKAKTNLEKIKEQYEDIILDTKEEEKLSNTANLSLEILSDLKSNEDTVVTPPMKEEEETLFDDKDNSFYSSKYKFAKRDFEDDDDEELEESNKFSFKLLIIIGLIILMAIIIVYLVGYFSR